MTRQPDPPRSHAWWEGWRLGLADRANGAMTLICGATQEVLDKNAGYAAARYGRTADREAGPGRARQAGAEIEMEARS
jgi:hypothetical protein